MSCRGSRKHQAKLVGLMRPECGNGIRKPLCKGIVRDYKIIGLSKLITDQPVGACLLKVAEYGEIRSVFFLYKVCVDNLTACAV